LTHPETEESTPAVDEVVESIVESVVESVAEDTSAAPSSEIASSKSIKRKMMERAQMRKLDFPDMFGGVTDDVCCVAGDAVVEESRSWQAAAPF